MSRSGREPLRAINAWIANLPVVRTVSVSYFGK